MNYLRERGPQTCCLLSLFDSQSCSTRLSQSKNGTSHLYLYVHDYFCLKVILHTQFRKHHFRDPRKLALLHSCVQSLACASVAAQDTLMQEELCAASVYAICCMKVTTCFIGNTLCLASVAPTAVGDNLARKAWEHAYFPSTEKRPLCRKKECSLGEPFLFS